MDEIILSAGQSSRLGYLVSARPKCLIDFPPDVETARIMAERWNVEDGAATSL